MKFSIVTPSFNQGRFLRDCIESVRCQTGVDWEHIVIDAGSTDETLSVLKEYPHLQWISEPDRGMSDGINKGFRRAQGDWVMWLNGDDYLLPGALQTMARFADAHPEADVIYGGWEFVDAEKKRLKRMKVFPFDLRMMIYYGPYIGSTACFYRKQTVIDGGFLLAVDFRQCMDMEYYARLGRAGKVFRYCPEIIAAFRLHGDNTSFRHLKASTIDEHLKRQKQIAESAAVRRCYGLTMFNEPFADGVVDAVLWYYYRLKKVVLKLIHGSYR
jgi:glycosyltransferase involved in cell wall biosynthesis